MGGQKKKDENHQAYGGGAEARFKNTLELPRKNPYILSRVFLMSGPDNEEAGTNSAQYDLDRVGKWSPHCHMCQQKQNICNVNF